MSILDGNSQSSFRFSPSSITVAAGDTVTWTNNGSASEGHDVSGSGGLGSGTLHSGQSYSHTFASPGTFSYICSIHPFMKGTVTVQGTSSGGGDGGGGGDQAATPPTGTSPTSPGSESAAVTSADAAGSATQLPSTGMPLLPLLAGRLRAAARGGAAAPPDTRQPALAGCAAGPPTSLSPVQRRRLRLRLPEPGWAPPEPSAVPPVAGTSVASPSIASPLGRGAELSSSPGLGHGMASPAAQAGGRPPGARSMNSRPR